MSDVLVTIGVIALLLLQAFLFVRGPRRLRDLILGAAVGLLFGIAASVRASYALAFVLGVGSAWCIFFLVILLYFAPRHEARRGRETGRARYLHWAPFVSSVLAVASWLWAIGYPVVPVALTALAGVTLATDYLVAKGRARGGRPRHVGE